MIREKKSRYDKKLAIFILLECLIIIVLVGLFSNLAIDRRSNEARAPNPKL